MKHKRFDRRRRSHAILYLVVGMNSVAASAQAQVSGTWVGAATGNWNNAFNWTSNPSVPGSGGMAAFNAGAASLNLDTTVVLNTLSLNTTAQVNLQFSNLIFTAPALIDAAQYKQSAPGTNLYLGHEISSSLGTQPGGSNGTSLRFRGPGAVVLKATQTTHFANTIIDAGARLGVTHSAELGSTTSILLNTGTLRTLANSGSTTIAIDISRPIQIHPNGGTLAGVTAPMNVTGAISGGGTLNFSGLAGVTLSTANSFAGVARVVGGGTAGLTLNNGSLQFCNTLEVGGQLNVIYSTNADCLGLGTLALRGGTANLVQYSGTEQIGTLSLVGGHSSIITTNGTSGTFTLQSTALDRNDRGTLVVKADGLGVLGPANRVSRIFFDQPGTIPLVGGGGAAGTTNRSILPFAIHAVVTGSTSFLTYDALGLRPLDLNTEYLQAFPAETISTANVRLNTTTLNAPQTINALLMRLGTALSGTGTLTLTSGVLAGNPSINGCTVTSPIDFGPAEGVVTGIANLTGIVTGSNGVTIAATGGTILFGNPASSYSGTTTINTGQVHLILGADVVAGQPGILGADTSPVMLVGRGSSAGLVLNGSTLRSFGRDLTVRSDPELLRGFEPLLRVLGPQVNGNIALEGPLRIETQGNPAVINGIVSGPGRLVIGDGTSLTSVTLSGANTFAGGIDVRAGAVAALSDQALGSGTLFTSIGTNTINECTLSIGTLSPLTARTIANPIVMTAGMRLSGLGELNLAGPIDLNGEQRAITVIAPLRATVSGSIFGGDLRWTGAGTLSGENAQRSTYATGGPLFITNSHALGVTPTQTQVGSLSVPGSSIEFVGGVNIPAHPMLLYGGVRGSGGNNTWGGSILAPFGSTFTVTSDTLTIAGGMDGGSLTGSNGTIKNGPGILATLRIRTPRELRIDEGTMAILPGGTNTTTSKVGSLTLATTAEAFTAALDLADNALVIDYGTDSPAAAVGAMLASGYAGGAWTGQGIRSSTAATTSGRGVGYAEATALGSPATFMGQNIDETSLLLRYTLYGDADLSGGVDLDDFTRLAASFGLSSTWTSGDFNYDSVTNLDDFTALAANFGVALPATPPSRGGTNSAVPEPSSVAVLGALFGVRSLTRRNRPAARQTSDVGR